MSKTAIVWGANGGIGRALVSQLAGAGWVVTAVGKDELALPSEATHLYEVENAADDTAVRNAIREMAYELEDVPLWIYAVGDITAVPVGDMDTAAWTRILNANLTGAYTAIHHSLPLLAEDAHIMFVGAVQERLRLPGLSAYAAAKAGLEAFADALKKEQRKKRVTVVRPGAVATPLWNKVPLRQPKDAMSAEKLAVKMLEAHENGHKGHLDF